MRQSMSITEYTLLNEKKTLNTIKQKSTKILPNCFKIKSDEPT